MTPRTTIVTHAARLNTVDTPLYQKSRLQRVMAGHASSVPRGHVGRKTIVTAIFRAAVRGVPIYWADAQALSTWPQVLKTSAVTSSRGIIAVSARPPGRGRLGGRAKGDRDGRDYDRFAPEVRSVGVSQTGHHHSFPRRGQHHHSLDALLWCWPSLIATQRNDMAPITPDGYYFERKQHRMPNRRSAKSQLAL